MVDHKLEDHSVIFSDISNAHTEKGGRVHEKCNKVEEVHLDVKKDWKIWHLLLKGKPTFDSENSVGWMAKDRMSKIS